MRNVLAAVRAARANAADVRVVPFATPAAIRAELDRGPAHVLHITGHGSPGLLDLEDEDGTARPVTADEFCDQAIPPGRMPPVVTLAACYTDAAATQGGVSFAARLCQRGAAAVIATETSITDTYANRLLARVYAALARARDADVVAALASARREVQAELGNSPDKRDQELAGMGEWAAVTILAASGYVPLLDPDVTVAVARYSSRPPIAGLAGRDDHYFVGRRAEQRRWPSDLIASGLAGIVICGIGGTGKTTLAAEITARVLAQDTGRILVSLAGPLTLEGMLSQVISALRRELLVRNQDGDAIRALDVAARADLPWTDRWAVLRQHVLGAVPVLAVLDNFEDNLKPNGADVHVIRDEALAGFLAAWASDPGASRLLVTCRYPFTLPGATDRSLAFRQLGPLSRAETMKLAWSLPALDRLDEGELDRVWRLVGGHPRSLEYLDALLSGGTARYPDVTNRLETAITGRLDGASRDRWLAARTGLDVALAETISLAADDVLLDDLLARLAGTPGAPGLLLGVSTYREPVDLAAILFQAGQPDPGAEDIPDHTGAYRRCAEILVAEGINVNEPFDLAGLPEQTMTLLEPHIAVLSRTPAPPFRAPTGLAQQITACQAVGLLTVSESDSEPWFFVHRWTATELSGRADSDQASLLNQAHRQAAAYWRWRVQVWSQVRTAKIHDLLEARYHLLQAGATEDAGEVTEFACGELRIQGAWNQEVALIHDTLAQLPTDSPRRAAWSNSLGNLALDRGEYDEAERHYRRALDIEEQVGDQDGLADTYHNLGALAQKRGDYDEAERQYQRSLGIKERLGDQIGLARSYLQLGSIAKGRGDYAETERQYQRALDICERLGSEADLAITYHQLGLLAHDRGDYDEAERHYRRALDIDQRRGDQDGLASTYHQLGLLAHNCGEYDEATPVSALPRHIRAAG